ncbi:hypothetical protein Hanom_Chr09g00849721 [Helianthus anomalus]
MPREQLSSTQATEIAAEATTEGESGGGAGSGQDKGKDSIQVDTSLSKKSVDEDILEENYLENDDLDRDDVVEGVVDDWKSNDDIIADIDQVEIKKGGGITYIVENLPIVNFTDIDFEHFKAHIYNNEDVKEIAIPEEIPKEIGYGFFKWLKAPPLDPTQKKRYINTHGEYSGETRS